MTELDLIIQGGACFFIGAVGMSFLLAACTDLSIYTIWQHNMIGWTVTGLVFSLFYWYDEIKDIQCIFILLQAFGVTCSFLSPRIALGDNVAIKIARSFNQIMPPMVLGLIAGIYYRYDDIVNVEIDIARNNLTKFESIYTLMMIYNNLTVNSCVDGVHLQEKVIQYFFETVYWNFAYRYMCPHSDYVYILDAPDETILFCFLLFALQLYIFVHTLRPGLIPFILAFCFEENFEYSLLKGVFRPENEHPEYKWKQVLILMQLGKVKPQEFRNVLSKMFLVKMFNDFDNLSKKQKHYFLQFLIFAIQYEEARSLLLKLPKFWNFVKERTKLTNKIKKNKNFAISDERKTIETCFKLLGEILKYWPKRKIQSIPNLEKITFNFVEILHFMKKQSKLSAFHITLHKFTDMMCHILGGLKLAYNEDIFRKQFKNQSKTLVQFEKKNMQTILDKRENIKNFRNDNLSDIPKRICQTCGKNNKELGKQISSCSRCKSVFYCNEKCQGKDWKEHKKYCKKLKK